MSDVPDSPIETITPTLTHQWLCNNQISCFTLKSSARKDGELWAERTKQSILNWPIDRPYFSILDLTDPNMSLTPYFKEVSGEVQSLRPELRGYVALIMRPGFVSQLMQLMLRARAKVTRRTQVFFNYDDGMRWLKLKMATEQANKQKTQQSK